MIEVVKERISRMIGKKNYNNLLDKKNKIQKKFRRIKWAKKYRQDLKEYQMLNRRERFNYTPQYKRPILGEWEESAGLLGPYFWQDLWAARLIYQENPKEHYDIGSRIQGFIGHLCSFRENIKLIDVRPLDKKIPGVTFIQDDAKSLKHLANSSIKSISSLCAIEHFGLGRYGDEIDPEGCFKALSEMERVLCKGGYCICLFL